MGWQTRPEQGGMLLGGSCSLMMDKQDRFHSTVTFCYDDDNVGYLLALPSAGIWA